MRFFTRNSQLATRNYYRPWVALIALALCVALLLLPLAGFIASTSGWLGYPYPRPGSEGLILYESLLVKRGGDIYGPITPQSFISGPYPPIYYWLASTTLPTTLPDFSTPRSVSSMFQGGRTISLIAALVAAATIPLTVIFEAGYERQRRTLLLAAVAGLAGGIAFLTLPQTTVWASRFRGDMLMVGFTAAGLLCTAIGTRQPPPDPTSRFSLLASRSLLPLAAVLFAAAFFTKQTALAGPVAAAIYLLLRDWRAGLRWCLLMAACVAVPFLLLDAVTAHWFYLKMVSYHSLPLRSVTLTRLLQFAFWEDQWPLILLALGYIIYRVVSLVLGRRRGGVRTAPSLVALYALASLAFLPTGAVVGADHNHLLLPGLGISLAVGASLAWGGIGLLDEVVRLPALAPVALAMLLVIVYALVTSSPSSWYDPDLTLPSANVQEQYRKIVENVRENPGTTFFSDDPGIVALAGKQTPYDDPFTMTALAQTSRWDESAYRTMLQQGKFGLLVLSCDVTTAQQCRADTFTPGVLDAIRSGYRILFRDIMYTYIPR